MQSMQSKNIAQSKEGESAVAAVLAGVSDRSSLLKGIFERSEDSIKRLDKILSVS